MNVLMKIALCLSNSRSWDAALIRAAGQAALALSGDYGLYDS